MIPKKIHYVWVGSKPKPELVLRCIESWKKYCPDYEIKEWNNETAAVVNNLYMQQALQAGKYAFASDVIRLYALKHEGGFYFDTDLEITAPIDEFCNHSFVTGYENYNGEYYPITAFMASEPGNNIVSDLLSEYDNIPFWLGDYPDTTTNTSRITKYFSSKFNLHAPYDGANMTNLADGCTVYPSYYFCTPEEGKINYAIHHFNGSWKIKSNWTRKKLLSISPFRLAWIKRQQTLEKDVLPIWDDERLIKTWQIGKNIMVCLIRKLKK